MMSPYRIPTFRVSFHEVAFPEVFHLNQYRRSLLELPLFYYWRVSNLVESVDEGMQVARTSASPAANGHDY
jgi:hypothetical protein